MAQVFIAFRRTDIPNSTLAVKDLQPNAMTRDVAYDSVAQGPYYVRQPVSATVATVGTTAISVPRATEGLAAYIISHVEAAGAGTPAGALTATQANTAATNILAAARSGAVLTLAAINTILDAIVADTELTDAASASTGTVADVLAIVAGKKFTLPAGTVVQTNTNVFSGMTPTATAAAFYNGGFRTLYTTDSLMMSVAAGDLSVYTSATFTYKGIVAAAVVVYNDDGSIYVP